jgi:hypothetical protein
MSRGDRQQCSIRAYSREMDPEIFFGSAFRLITSARRSLEISAARSSLIDRLSGRARALRQHPREYPRALAARGTWNEPPLDA